MTFKKLQALAKPMHVNVERGRGREIEVYHDADHGSTAIALSVSEAHGEVLEMARVHANWTPPTPEVKPWTPPNPPPTLPMMTKIELSLPVSEAVFLMTALQSKDPTLMACLKQLGITRLMATSPESGVRITVA